MTWPTAKPEQRKKIFKMLRGIIGHGSRYSDKTKKGFRIKYFISCETRPCSPTMIKLALCGAGHNDIRCTFLHENNRNYNEPHPCIVIHMPKKYYPDHNWVSKNNRKRNGGKT